MRLDDIRNDLENLSDMEVVIFGSTVKGGRRPNSDIDVAIISRSRSEEKNLQLFSDVIGKAPDIYDIKIFEMLPLKIKASLIDNYVTVFGNESDISYYFYQYRKLWDDCRHRVMEGYQGRFKDMLERGRKGEEAIARIREKRSRKTNF